MILSAYILLVVLLVVQGSVIMKSRDIHPSSFIGAMISVALVLTLTTFLFFISLVLGIGFGWVFAALLLLSLLLFVRYKNIFAKVRFRDFALFDTYNILFIVAAIFTVYASGDSLKWGGFDSWMIWHQHAKFLCFDEWRNMFSEELAFSHPDYPLLYPAIIAFIWKCLGSFNELVPYLFSLFFVLIVPATVFFALKKYNPWIGVLIGIYIVLHEYFIMSSMFQYADIILSFFILLAVIIAVSSEENKDALPQYFLIGFLVASSAWIKNEGFLFLICFFLARIVFFYNNKKLFVSFVAGCVIPLSVILFFKLTYAPSNDLVSTTNSGTLSKIFDISRHIMIYNFFAFQWIYKFQVPLLIFLALLFNISRPVLKLLIKEFVFILIVSLGFLFIYLTTFQELDWHLRTSMSRLMFQVMPAFLFVCGYGLSVIVSKK